MKKILLILLGGAVAALLSGAVLIWNATADAAMEVVIANARYIKRQMPFDYDTLSIESHFLKPAIVMTNPSLRFDTHQGKYRLVAAQMEFIPSFSSLGEYTIKLPSKFLLEKTGKETEAVLFKIDSYPEMEVRSSEKVEGKPVESIYLDEFRLEKSKSLLLEVPIKGKKPTNNTALKFTPPALLTLGWTPIRYDLGVPLNRFVSSVEQVTHAAP